MPRRVIVDADARPGTEIWQEFQSSLGGEQCEYLFLTETHVGIPDVEILDKLLQQGDTLLAGDCVLHMHALARGHRSLTLDDRDRALTPKQSIGRTARNEPVRKQYGWVCSSIPSAVPAGHGVDPDRGEG